VLYPTELRARRRFRRGPAALDRTPHDL